jgi:PAS domain S-box-containing protein
MEVQRPSSTESPEFRAAQVRQLYAQSRAGTIGALVSIIVVALALQEQVSDAKLITWVVTYVIVQVPRSYLVLDFPSRTTAEGIIGWGRKFCALTVVSGAIWGLAAIIAFPASSHIHQMFLAIALAGIASAAAAVYAPVKVCYGPTVLAILLPLSIRYFYEGGAINFFIGVSIMIFATVLALAGRQINSVVTESLRLQFEKDDLVESLIGQQSVTEHLNENLLGEIEERKRTEKALKQSEQRLELALKGAEMGLWDWYVQTGDLFLDHRWTKSLSFSLTETKPIMDSWLDLIHEEDLPGSIDKLNRHLQGVTDFYESEHRLKSNSGSWRWMLHRGAVVERDESGKPLRMTGTYLDITDGKKAKEALSQTETRYKSLLDTMNEGFGIHDCKGLLMYVNDRLCEMWKCSREEAVGSPVTDFLDDTNRLLVREKMELRKRGIAEAYETVGVRRDGTRFPVVISPKPIFDAVGKYAGSCAVITDITERKAWEKRIQASLEEKEVLLREIHHRVKNNLAVVSSLLRLQSRHTRDGYHRGMFEEAQDRIRSIALAHEKLYQSESLADLNVRDYLTNLVDHLFASGGKVGSTVQLQSEIAEIDVGLEIAVTLGFIVTELVSNSLKHAFPEGRSGRVLLSLKRLDESTLELVVADDGVGFPAHVQVERARTLGLDLVRIFSRQLEGRLDVRHNQGTEFVLRFDFRQ